MFLLDGGMLFGLHTHATGNSGDQADETRTGLDHIGISFRDPDNIALEFFIAPGT